MDLVEAAVEAGVTRLRPVLLTAGTTVLGLIPMASGHELRLPHVASGPRKSESSAVVGEHGRSR